MSNNTPQGGTTGRVASEAKEKIKEKAADLASSAKQQAQQQYETRVGGALTEVHQFASALRETGQRLRDQNGSQIGAMVINRVADRLDSVHSAFDGKDLEAVVGNVELFARRNPAAFLGTAAALGFLAARFLKSSGRNVYGLTEASEFSSDFTTGYQSDSMSMPRTTTGGTTMGSTTIGSPTIGSTTSGTTPSSPGIRTGGGSGTGSVGGSGTEGL